MALPKKPAKCSFFWMAQGHHASPEEAGVPTDEAQKAGTAAMIKQSQGKLREAERDFRKGFSKARAIHLGEYILKAEAKSREGDVKGFWRHIKKMASTFEGSKQK